MKIALKINKENNITLSLLEGKRDKGSLAWKDANNLSHFLLANLDKILRKNKLGPGSVRNSKKKASKRLDSRKFSNGVDKISDFEIISGVPRNWTSVRIAKITLESLMIAGLAK